MTSKVSLYLIPVLLLLSSISFAQNDTIQLKNNDILVGEVKSLFTGIIIIETFYSDEDFKIEFNKVETLFIQRKCLIVLTEGRRRFGNIRSATPGTIEIILEDGKIEHFKLEEIIAIQLVEKNFWKRFHGSIDLGFNAVKANNKTQINLGGDLNYFGEKWRLEGQFTMLGAAQDSTENIKRTDASLELHRIFSEKWYLLGHVSFLANTEQALDGRLGTSLGVGRLIITTNKLYLGFSVGINENFEGFVDQSLNKSSSEALISSILNMYSFKDLTLKTGIKFYPSLTVKGRLRANYDFTLKYDLPLDLYIKTEFALDFDNQPAILGNKYDYILTFGVGWDIN